MHQLDYHVVVPATEIPDTRNRFESFAEFWPFYVGAHRSKACRTFHYLGAIGAISAVVCAVMTASWWCLALAPVVGYACAWLGHFGFERNHPATFEYPLYSLRAEFKMFALGVFGRMPAEVRRHCDSN